jgi:WD40 repeat protein
MYAGPDEKICILSTNLNGGTRSIMSLSNSDATLQSLRTRNYIFNWKSDAVLFFDKVLSRVGNVPFKEFTEHMELSVCWHSLKSAQGYSQDVVSFDYVQTDKLLLTLCNSGIVKLWDTTSGEQKIEFLGHEDRITAASFSECGRRVITGSRDGTVHVWDIAKGKQISSIHIGDEVQSAFFLDACDNIAALTRESVFFGGFSAFSIWNLQFGVRKLNIVTHSDETIVSFSPDKKLLLSLSNLGDLRIRSTKTGRILGYSLGFRRFTGIIAGEKNYKILALNPNYCEVIPFQPAKSGWILI